ncbi:MucB/RseB C-terminal domain-containing protein [Halomonas lysinitropha]|uniref:Sigma factor AlgU regulatory protein MucB n=1 Tax=Halomonas lysinitropha TaxID=2607506 RepID=A0A5K1I491_9GAMM|nr:MucB/RseB C-terminal domain-containing protein [Halomonas lysinitropha]VVZ96266.1 Sigma factor AlgU regulatory protein MucB precursor [Halomonas lysinitropha]
MRQGLPTRGLTRLLVTALLTVSFGVVAQPDAERGNSERFDCRDLAEHDAPETAPDWLEQSLWASHCYEFRARAVRIGADGVRSLALSHDVVEGAEREVARFLDGPPVVFERRGRIGRLSWAEGEAPVPASPAGITDHLDGLYRLRLSGEERLANRTAIRLDIEPLDDLRYGHRFWLDTATALPLKHILLDEQGRVVETFQITELHQPQLHQGEIGLDRRRDPPEDPWHAVWLPEGFIPQPVETRSSRHADDIGHRVYSDGLATLSLFVEPVEGSDQLIPGMHRLGISHAAVRHRELGGRTRQVVVMGELPPGVLLRVADSVEWRDGAEGSMP